MLIAALSVSPEPPNVPTFTSPVPVSTVPPVPMLSVPDPVSPTESTSQFADNDVLFQLRSGRNFAVQLLRHMFTPSELEGRNVRGVGGKLPLNTEKIIKIKDIVFRFFILRNKWGKDSSKRIFSPVQPA